MLSPVSSTCQKNIQHVYYPVRRTRSTSQVYKCVGHAFILHLVLLFSCLFPYCPAYDDSLSLFFFLLLLKRISFSPPSPSDSQVIV